MSAGVSAHSTVAPRAVALRSKISSQTSRSSSARWRIACAASRVPLEVVELGAATSRRLVTNLPWIFCRLLLQLRVAEVVVRALLEMHRRDLHGSPARLARASRTLSGETSATCSTRVCRVPAGAAGLRCSSMQPRSPSTTASAPVSAMCRHLLSASRDEISPNLIENVPPKPQHVSHSAISRELRGRALREQRARAASWRPSRAGPQQLS